MYKFNLVRRKHTDPGTRGKGVRRFHRTIYRRNRDAFENLERTMGGFSPLEKFSYVIGWVGRNKIVGPEGMRIESVESIIEILHTMGKLKAELKGGWLQKELEKAVLELGKEMERKPELVEGIKYFDTSVEIDGFRGRNYLECEGNLVRRMREAYHDGDLEELNRIPLFILAYSNEWEEYRGRNSMAFVLPVMGTNKLYPFGNETSGEHTQIIVNSFKWTVAERIAIDKIAEEGVVDLSVVDKLKERGRLNIWSNIVDGVSPTFLVFLFREVEGLDRDLEKIRDDIVGSKEYLGVLKEVQRSECTENDFHRLRRAYRKEEFKRKDKIVELCLRAERVYGLAGKFYERLKAYLQSSK